MESELSSNDSFGGSCAVFAAIIPDNERPKRADKASNAGGSDVPSANATVDAEGVRGSIVGQSAQNAPYYPDKSGSFATSPLVGTDLLLGRGIRNTVRLSRSHQLVANSQISVGEVLPDSFEDPNSERSSLSSYREVNDTDDELDEYGEIWDPIDASFEDDTFTVLVGNVGDSRCLLIR